MDEGNAKPKQGVFYNGQIYDAYTFVSDLIKSAKRRIILIDNYVDETVLTLLDKRDNNVSAIIYTQQISRQFQLDIDSTTQKIPKTFLHGTSSGLVFRYILFFYFTAILMV